MSFRETREMLLLAYDSKIISDEEFLVLWESCHSKNPHFPYSSYARFDLENIHGFIDRSVRPIARPDQQSRIVYNGHKRVHLLKFQSVTPQNGLIGNMYGPVGMLVIYIFLLQRFRSRFSQYSRLLFGRERVCVALFLCLITLL